MKFVKSEPSDEKVVTVLREQLLSALQTRIQQLQAQKAPVSTEPPRYSGPLFSASFQSELQWLAGDFKSERQWKRDQTKKIGKELIKYLSTRETQETKLRKIATSIAKDVERYWRSVGEVVKHRSKKRKAIKVKEEKSRKLEYLVNKTEMFMGKVVNAMLGHRSSHTPAATSALGSASASPGVSTPTKSLSPSEPDHGSDADMPQSDSDSGRSSAEEVSDSESSLDLEEENDSDLETRERAEASDLLADADRPIEEILAEMQRAASETSEDSDAGSHPSEDSEASDSSGISVSEGESSSSDYELPQASSSSSSAGGAVEEELAELEAAQPSGTTLTSSSVTIPIPSLLRGQMRDYQHIGLQWLAALGDRIPGKILADEPGLGKTLQSIALLAHLACAEGIWGPHLIIVPTSVLLNWEVEFKKFCPGMKVLVYFGSVKERAALRTGWNKPNTFHVLITSYSIVLQDAHIFRKKRWYYMILDEAHNIKNFKSQRWQTLLTFNTERRLLLTGTPLSNDISDLWALLHFLVPDVFESHTEFSEWFGNPLKMAAEKQQLHMYQELIGRLQAMLRPFLLRRLKRDVEKQMPSKYEHVIKCPLTKRQRILYDEFIGLKETKSQLANGSYLGMMNVLMQLRKVCNHPDLFAERPVKSPFVQSESLVLNLPLSAADAPKSELLKSLAIVHASLRDPVDVNLRLTKSKDGSNNTSFSGRLGLEPFRTAAEFLQDLLVERQRQQTREREFLTYGEYVEREYEQIEAELMDERNRMRFQGLATSSFQVDKDDHLILSKRSVEIGMELGQEIENKLERLRNVDVCGLPKLVLSTGEQAKEANIEELFFVQRRAKAPVPELKSPEAGSQVPGAVTSSGELGRSDWAAVVSSELLLPDKRYLEWDCGKLKVLSSLLRRLYNEGHKCILFTQMSKMLDILEAWINTQSYAYVRLDGGTKVEVRQALIDKFNTDNKVFLFISSTRTSGVGINLTAADCVIFYDSDWSAAMDKQAIDRAHRISQTRDVHVYRLISEYTIEENIFRKQLQKRAIDEAVIDGGRFDEHTMEKWTAGDVKQILEMDGADVGDIYGTQTLFKQLDGDTTAVEVAMAQVEDEEDVKAMQGVLKETGGKLGGTGEEEFMSKEEKAFNALPGIVKASVRFLEDTRDEEEGEDAGEGDSDVEVLMEGWESEDEEEERGRKTKRARMV